MVISSAFRERNITGKTAIRTEVAPLNPVTRHWRCPPCLNHCYPYLVCRTSRLRRLVSSSAACSGGQSNEEWIAKYERSHQHPVNRLCDTYGIPTILVSVAFFAAGFIRHRLWWIAVALFVLGWLLQFIGHIFEGKPPEFFHDWRFLFVGVRWWWAKINGKA